MFLIGPYSYPPGTMLSALQRLGLTSGLKLCLDAGDIASYDGTSQVWSDTSGGGYDFNRGSGSGSDAADPTFNGTAGRQSSGEYFSFDGGDYFTYDSANETWMQNIHKDNAAFSFAAWMYIASIGNQQPIIANTLSTGDVGFAFYVRDTIGTLRFTAARASAGNVAYLDGTLSVSVNNWHFLGVSLDEAVGAGGAVFQVDGVQETKSSTYTSPSSSSATNIVRIGHGDLTTSALPDALILNGGRLANVEAWEGVALTSAQLLSIFNATRSRFGV